MIGWNNVRSKRFCELTLLLSNKLLPKQFLFLQRQYFNTLIYIYRMNNVKKAIRS